MQPPSRRVVEKQSSGLRSALHSAPWRIGGCILFCLPFLLAGCNYLGFIADKSMLGKDKPAQYTLSKDSTVVIAENWRNPTGSETDAQEIEQAVYDELRQHDLGTQVSPTEVMDLKAQRPDFSKLSIAQIGKLVGAKQIIYINLTQTELVRAMGSDAYTGKATARVKVVDADTGESLWPIDNADGFPISVSTEMAMARTNKSKTSLRELLIQATAAHIAELFYTVHPTDE